MVIADETILVNRCGKSLPCLVHCLLVGGSRKNALLNTPCHTIEEETCTGHLRPTIVGWTNEAYVPVTIFALAFQDSLTHRDEILLQILIVFVCLWQSLHYADQGCIHPTIATAPVAVATILFLVRWHVVLVSPPETFFFIEETVSQGITAPFIGIHRIIQILAFAGNLGILGVGRHRHLDGINPSPVVYPVGTHLMV